LKNIQLIAVENKLGFNNLTLKKLIFSVIISYALKEKKKILEFEFP